MLDPSHYRATLLSSPLSNLAPLNHLALRRSPYICSSTIECSPLLLWIPAVSLCRPASVPLVCCHCSGPHSPSPILSVFPPASLTTHDNSSLFLSSISSCIRYPARVVNVYSVVSTICRHVHPLFCVLPWYLWWSRRPEAAQITTIIDHPQSPTHQNTITVR